jgi:hypothetical protein
VALRGPEVKLDWNWALGTAEDLLRSGLKSKAVREAEKRRLEHKAREAKRRFELRARDAGRRLGRAVAVTGASGAGMVGYGLAVAPLGTAGLFAATAATAVAAMAALSWPARREKAEAGGPEADFKTLPLRTEDYLLSQRAQLPGRAHAALDAIHESLADLARQAELLHAEAPLAGEARRLLESYLPRLIDSFLALPRPARTPEVCARLAESLCTVADELARLTAEIGRDRMLSFDTQERFIQSRYRERGW